MLQSMDSIPDGMIKNAWLHGEYSYFPEEARVGYHSNDNDNDNEDYDVMEQQELV